MSHIPYLLPPLYNLIFASTLPSFVSSNHVLTCQSLSPDGGFHRLPQAYASQTFGSISYLHQIYGAGTGCLWTQKTHHYDSSKLRFSGTGHFGRTEEEQTRLTSLSHLQEAVDCCHVCLP